MSVALSDLVGGFLFSKLDCETRYDTHLYFRTLIFCTVQSIFEYAWKECCGSVFMSWQEQLF